MTQSKTSLILNNLVELTIPTCTDSKYLTYSENKEMGFLTIKLGFPFTFLLQKVQLEENNRESAKSFNIEMITKHAVTHGQMRTIVHETEIIDFKKEKIDWRFKTRMRSNSNEFLGSPSAFVQKMQKEHIPYRHAASSPPIKQQEPIDSEDLSIMSSDEEIDLKQDGKILILGNGISNQFTLYINCNKDEDLIEGTANQENQKQKLSRQIERFQQSFQSVKLFVWPTFRLPTGSSVIALINTSFLFATKRLEQERLEADFLVALSLISGRKFIQASEKLRKIQSYLLSAISVKSLIQAMNIEIIIGESMNQHSQISEKMFAFQRAVLFYKLAKRVEKHDDYNINEIEQMINARSKARLKQEEAYKYLLHLQPHLVHVLLMNIDCHIQAVRMASLKTLEFLFDTLGCNLDESLIPILIAIIKTYPSMTKRSNVPKDGKVISFFADSWQLHTEAGNGQKSTGGGKEDIGQSFSQASQQNLNRFSPEKLSDQAQQSTFFSLNDIHSLKDCQVKDASLFHQSFIQTSKNFYNHILESMIFLISSTSTPILVRIFNEVIERVLFQESIEQDLQIYLLRLSERILQLCQGYVNVGKLFLNTLFKLILSRNSTEAQGTTNRGSNEDQTAKVANDLWQTLKTNYLLNQSNEGISSFISWVVHQFNNLTEKVTSTSTSGSSNKDSSDLNSFQAISQAQLRDATMSVNDQQKLLLLLDLTNLLVYGQLKHIKKSTKNYKERYKRRSLQKLAGRETIESSSSTSDKEIEPTNKEPESYRIKNQLGSQMKLISLEMCQIIDPVIFWLNFTIERPDRLNFFKAIWSTLTQLVQIIPKRRQMGVEIDCIQIILPTLQRVETFCKTSSPSLEMLQFLIVVFTDIKNLLLGLARKSTKRDFYAFLDGFISTFSQNIPHNLHDEVFEVCSLLIDLVGSNGFLKQIHVREVLEALVHKYTMRSKAHKRLSDKFLLDWILNQSLVQFEELKKLKYMHVEEKFLFQRPRNRTSSNQINSRHPIQFAAHGNNPISGISAEINEGQPIRNTGWNPSTEDYQDQQSHSEEEEKNNHNFVPSFQQPQQQPDAFASNLQLIGLLENMQDQQQNVQLQQQQVQMIPQQRASSQPSNFLQHANLAGVPNINSGENESTQANENGSNRVPNIEQKHFNSAQQRSLYFDTLCDFSLFQNFLPASDLFLSEQDQEQINFEKLSVLQDVIEALKEEHNSLFKRLLHHQDFNHKIATIFTNDRARGKIIKLMKSMTAYFLKYNSPKTFYEHPIVQTSALPQPQHQPQISARYQENMVERAHGTLSQLQLGGQQLHSEPSLDILNVMNQEDGHMFTQENMREQDLNLRRLNHHYSQHVERQQNFLFNFGQNEAEEDDSPHMAPSNVNLFLFDEVNLINNERLILIKTYTTLIRIQIEQMQADQSQENASKNSQSQLQALNMIDMLLFSLCPVPSFQNIVIRSLLSPESGGYHAGGGQVNNESGDFSYQIAQPHKISFQFIGLNSMLGSQMGISSHEPYNDAIPDFETMLIIDKGPICLSETQVPVEPNSFPKEFECWDIRYQHSRLALAFKFWPFVEQAMLNSSWNNVKVSCQSVLSKVVQISDVSQMSANYQKRLKDLLFPLLNKLLKSQEGEGKASGLNILGSFCGLSSFQAQSYKLSFEFSQNDDSEIQSRSRGDAVFDSEQGQDYDYDRYEQRQREALSKNQIRIKDHLHVFRRNSSFVSLAIWQEVFDLQENWNQHIRDAATVLIQLCAPKDSVKHFKKMSEEKFQLRLSEAQQQLKYTHLNKFINGQLSNARLNYASAGGYFNQTNGAQLGSTGKLQFNSLSVFNGIQNNEMFSRQSSQQQLLSAHTGKPVQAGPNFSGTGAQFNQDFNLLNEGTMPQTGRGHVQNPDKQIHQFNENKAKLGEYSEDLESSEDEDEGHILSDESEIFFMERLSERQLQQAISLFTSEFKPISSLWVDHTSQSKRVKSNKFNRMSSFGGAGMSLGSGPLGNDDEYFFDQGLTAGNPQQNLLIDFFEDNMLEEVASMDSKDDELVEKTVKSSPAFEIQQTTSQSDGEDLGIIDLDKQEGSEYDDFDQLDDEKLPVLKNTYSKKNRPNNSKSVSIGSRSQGDVLRIRSQALQVLKAVDEEINVQIQERPEILSGLQQSFGSHKSHEKKFNADLFEYRKRVLDDGQLHLPENNEWQSSLSESADRMQTKRRIQSGKAQSCLSEDQHITDRKDSSHNSKTNSSNNSTPMEIGDIQIIMHSEVSQKHQNQQQRMHHERDEPFYRDQMHLKNHEIRSQDNRNKRNVRQGQQISMQRVELSENDANEKGFCRKDREEYDVVSAPIKRSSDIREQRPSSGYKLSSSQTGKISIDSLTELSSPYGDQDSFTRSFTQRTEEEKKRTFGASSKKVISKTDSQAKTLATKKQQQPNANSLSRSSFQGQKNQIYGSSSFLQTVSKQTLTVQQKAQQIGLQQKQPVGKIHTNIQSKEVNKEIPGRSKQSQNVKIQGQTTGTLTQPQLKLILAKGETIKQSLAYADDKIQVDSTSKPADDNQTQVLTSQRLTSLHKPVLNSVHSQQVILLNTQKQPLLQTRQSSSKKQVTTRNSRNGAAIAQHAIQQSFSKEKRPNSLVLRQMPSGQPVIPKQAVKRNNYIAPQQSPRLAKKDGNLSQRSAVSRGGQDRRQSRQAQLIKHPEQPENDQIATSLQVTKYNQELDHGQMTVFNEDCINDDSDPVEDLI